MSNQTTFLILIKYATTEFEAIADFSQYEKCLDRFQSMLCFFKIAHSLNYVPGEEKEYTFYDNSIGVSLALKINK